MRPVRVLHLTSTPRGIGGVERLLLDMAPHYDHARFDVRHCNLFDEAEGEGVFPEALRATGLPYVEVKGNRWHQLPKVISELRQVIRKEQIDVLHLHMLHATIIGGIVGLLRGAPRVAVTKHYVYRALKNALLRKLDRASTNRADAAIAVSNHVRRDLLEHGADDRVVKVIHNGIDLKVFDRASSAPLAPLRRNDKELLLGCVGNLHALKGHEHLIKAMPRIVVDYPAARLVIIGEGPQRDRLRKLAISLGAEQAVTFLGFRSDVPAILRQIDLYVQPSLQESFGIVLLEAMAATRPVVAAKVEGIPEVVADGITGRLVPPADPEALASAVSSLLGDAAGRLRMGAAGRERVESCFDVRKTVRMYEDLYSQLAGSKSPDRSPPERSADSLQ